MCCSCFHCCCCCSMPVLGDGQHDQHNQYDNKKKDNGNLAFCTRLVQHVLHLALRRLQPRRGALDLRIQLIQQLQEGKQAGSMSLQELLKSGSELCSMGMGGPETWRVPHLPRSCGGEA